MERMKFSKIKIIVILAISLVVVGSVILFGYVYKNSEFVGSDDWYIEDLETISLDYARSINTDGGIVQVRRYTYIEYNNDIVKNNERHSLKEYPFSGADVQMQIGKEIYVFHVVKDEQGNLFVASHELYR